MKNIYKYFFGSFPVAGMKKKRLCEKKKKSCRELEWATAQFPVWVTILELYRDTTFLGTATRAMTRLATPTIRPWQGCDTATVRHDTALGAATHAAARDTARAHGLGAGRVAIQPMTRPGSATIRLGRGPRHGSTDATTWRPARAVRAAWAQCTQAGPGCAPGASNPVLTQCTVWDTVHVHCSRGFQKKNSNQIK